MERCTALATGIALLLCCASLCRAERQSWEKGGPEYLYVKPTKKPPHHGVYDKDLKCVDCHSYSGTDAYSSATMSLKKTRKGHMPRAEVEQAIRETLEGKGDYREIYILGTAFENSPLATVIELVLDPKTFTFYAMSEKQTEKLFHIASNPRISMAYVKQRDDYDYFGGALGVQIVGKATLLQGRDPEFADAARIYLPTMPSPPPTAPQPPPVDEMIKLVQKNKIITKIEPERIVILNRKFKAEGYHAVQIWSPDME